MLELRLGRTAEEDGDEYKGGYEVDPSDYIWANGQPISLNHSKFAPVDDDDSKVNWSDLAEEWADLEEEQGD